MGNGEYVLTLAWESLYYLCTKRWPTGPSWSLVVSWGRALASQ